MQMRYHAVDNNLNNDKRKSSFWIYKKKKVSLIFSNILNTIIYENVLKSYNEK